MNQPIQPIDTPIMLFDGTSVSNPGAAAAAAILLLPNGRRYTVSQFLSFATQSEAEYKGLIIGLRKAKQLGIKKLEIKGDSELIFHQVNNLTPIKEQSLQNLYQEVQKLMNAFAEVNLECIPEEQNRPAIAAVNRCIGEALGIESKPPAPPSPPLSPPVAHLIKLGTQATDQDYRRLKVAADELTFTSLVQLRDLVPLSVQDTIAMSWNGDEEHLADIYRWYLRGLPPQMALRKVKIEHPQLEQEAEKLPWEGELLGSPFAKEETIETSEPFFSSPEAISVNESEFPAFSRHEIAEKETLLAFPFAKPSSEESVKQTIPEQDNKPSDPSRDTLPSDAKVQSMLEMLNALSKEEKQLLVEELMQLPEWVNGVLKAIADRLLHPKG